MVRIKSIALLVLISVGMITACAYEPDPGVEFVYHYIPDSSGLPGHERGLGRRYVVIRSVYDVEHYKNVRLGMLSEQGYNAFREGELTSEVFERLELYTQSFFDDNFLVLFGVTESPMATLSVDRVLANGDITVNRMGPETITTISSPFALIIELARDLEV